jgi:hypothetical protein
VRMQATLVVKTSAFIGPPEFDNGSLHLGSIMLSIFRNSAAALSLLDGPYSSLARHPRLDIVRAAKRRDSLRLTRVQKANALDIHKVHLIQIQRYSWASVPEFGLHLINVLRSKFAT